MRCPICHGQGATCYEQPVSMTITMDMAIDAGDRSLAGQQTSWGSEQVEEPCQYCNSTGSVMDFNEYQDKANGVAIYPNIGTNVQYTVLGLAGEAGEVAEKTKKMIRDRGSYQLDAEYVEQVRKELGDVLWYIAATCSELGLRMDDVAKENINKLYSRKDRGVLQGSGDDR